MNTQHNNPQWYQSYDEEEARKRRALRIQEMKKQKARRILLQNCIKIAVPIMTVILVAVVMLTRGKNNSDDGNSTLITEESAGFSSVLQESDGSGTGIADGSDGLNGGNALSADGPNSTGGLNGSDGLSGGAGLNGGDGLNGGNGLDGDDSSADPNTTNNVPTGSATAQIVYSANTTADTLELTDEVISTHALLIDLENDNILAQKDAKTMISPASMTKVLTILVAAEHITEDQLDDTFTMSLEITDYGYVNDCSSAGFLNEEVITVKDLFYGTILPSGADAAVGLAYYVAGSQEAFVELMNEKLEALGLSKTAHMTNCVGVYNKEHYCTVYDMAMIMEAAIANDLCREVMTAHTYTTSVTNQHPEGILLSNWFLRRIEDKDTGGEVICAKTGFVAQSGSCAVSYAIDNGGKSYVCVTANSTSSWKCIYDHVALYKMFATE